MWVFQQYVLSNDGRIFKRTMGSKLEIHEDRREVRIGLTRSRKYECSPEFSKAGKE